MEQGISPQSIEKLRGDRLAAFYEQYVSDHVVPIAAPEHPLDDRSGEYQVNMPAMMLEGFTNEPIDSLYFSKRLLSEDGSPDEATYTIHFRNYGENVFSITHVSGQEYDVLDPDGDFDELNLDEKKVANLLALIVDLECMKNMAVMSLGGIPVIGHSAVGERGALQPPATPDLVNVVIRGAGAAITAAAVSAEPATAATVTSPETGAHEIGNKFKQLVHKYTGESVPAPGSNMIREGSWHAQMPIEHLPIEDDSFIDTVSFYVYRVAAGGTEDTGARKNFIVFSHGDESIVTVVRNPDRTFEFIFGKRERVEPAEPQVVAAIMEDIEKLDANGELLPE